MSNQHFDVVIIGGRIAGASLAIRLKNSGLKVLLLERATFPSLPNVPSSPLIYPGTLPVMRELGIPEAEYAHADGKYSHLVMQFVGYFEAIFPVSRANLEHDYAYGIDRNKFDNALWKHAAQTPNVTARDGFSVTEILKNEAGDVIGVRGKDANGTPETFTADLVVGADGRFSFAARQFGAKVIEEHNQYTSASYHAEWENVDPYAPDLPQAMTMYNTNKNFLVIVIPIDTRKYIIGTYMRSSDAHFGAQGVENAYLEGLKRIPHLQRRLKNATRITDVVGVRPIENGYREAFGKGWALVGDALHYKDPSDGQGIYDALLESKHLAGAIIDWKSNGTSWDTSGESYRQHVHNDTHPVFMQTVKNVKQNVYSSVPSVVAKTIIRWVMNDPEYQTTMLRYLSRALNPAEHSIAPKITPQFIVRNIIADLRNGKKKNRATVTGEMVAI